jgi:hypothetical protein
MKTEFIQPRFEGARFAENTLPLDVAKDLAAYETLLVELAKHLYLKDHPERQRVLKGFAADFHLHLERVDDGSARPMLSLVTAGALALGLGANTYFERARDLITECVGAPDGQLPADFPQELLAYFNQIGRSLNADERMELPVAGGQPAVLTPERRKRLVLAANAVYERPIELAGTVVEANWEKSSFQLRQMAGDPAVVVVPMPDAFHGQARTSGGRDRHQITVKGVGAFDSWDRLQKIVSVESLEVQPDYQLAGRFDELRSLDAGWHDGQGVALDRSKLDQVAAKMVGHYPEKLPLPALVPTPEGNLLFEWNTPSEPSLDLNLATLAGAFHAFDPEKGDLEHEFKLSESDEWPKLFSFLTHNLGQVSV